MIMRYLHAIAVKVGWGKIKDVMIRPGSLAALTLIHDTEMSNLALVCIWEWSRITGSAVVIWGEWRGTVRSAFMGCPSDAPNKSRRACQMILPCWKGQFRQLHKRTPCNSLPGLWVFGHDQAGGWVIVGTKGQDQIDSHCISLSLHFCCWLASSGGAGGTQANTF
jgi:hypothetical protein